MNYFSFIVAWLLTGGLHYFGIGKIVLLLLKLRELRVGRLAL